MKLLVFAAGLGFLLGMRHAMDPDHLVAVSTLVARTRRLGASWLLGAVWGLGHTLTIFLVGGAILLLKLSVPERLALSLELAVGVVLVALGALNLRRRVPQAGEHSHAHGHEGPHGHHLPFTDRAAQTHEHPHEHSRALERLGEAVASAGGGALSRAFGVGLVHGLAGSAAVALLVLATIPDPRGGLVYLLVFGSGTLVGMVALSALMEASFYWASRRWRAEEWVRSGTGLLSLLFGLYVIYTIGWVDGLFLGTARWTPH